MTDYLNETAEQFQERYPRPESHGPNRYKRVLVRCHCDFASGPHWGWGWWYFNEEGGGLAVSEELAEEVPVRG